MSHVEALPVAVIAAALVALDVLSWRFGHDSRDGVRSAAHRRGQLWWAEPEWGAGCGRAACAPARRGVAEARGTGTVFSPFYLEMYARHKQEQALREAAEARLRHEARLYRAAAGASAPRRTRLRAALVRRIGAQLVAWGQRLQASQPGVPREREAGCYAPPAVVRM